jgi:hypothetical protein
VIAGKLPMAMACNSYNQATGACTTACNGGDTSHTCYVVAMVNIPGQNLNNAMAVNYAGVYHSGACVKVPNCPLASMVPDVVVVPVSVTGMSDLPTGTCTPGNTANCNAYPINSFTGFATISAPVYSCSSGSFSHCAQAPFCANQTGSPTGPGGTTQGCFSDNSGTPLGDNDPNARYWRVCLAVSTPKGVVNPPTVDNAWGQLMGTVMVITRCVPGTETNGSNFTVYTNQW